MKNYLITLFLFCSYSIFSQKTQGKITYTASTKKALDYRRDNNDNIKIKNDITDIYKKAKDVKVILNFNELFSEYYVIDKLDIGNEDNLNITHIMAGSEKKYYTYNSILGYKSRVLDCYLLGECFFIENLSPKWELKQETKMIQGFLCYNAIIKNPKTQKTTIDAWYAPSIPYQYGIMEFYGLPGVILEINRKSFTITAIKIELNPLEKIVIEEPKKVKKLTNKEFEELRKKSFSEFYKN